MSDYTIIKNKETNKNICVTTDDKKPYKNLIIEASQKSDEDDNFIIVLDEKGLLSLKDFIDAQFEKKTFKLQVDLIETYEISIKANSLGDAIEQQKELIKDVNTSPFYHLENNPKTDIWKGVSDEVVLKKPIEIKK